MRVLLIVLLVTGCDLLPHKPRVDALPRDPTHEAIAAADYGAAPDVESVKESITRIVESRLLDPGSAQYRWGVPERAWFRAAKAGSTNRFAWSVPVFVNAKNVYGGYTGFQLSQFYFRGDRMVGMSRDELVVEFSGAFSAEEPLAAGVQ